MTGDLDKRIRQRAYEIWENEGRPEGRSDQHWQQARAEFADVQAQSATQPGNQARGKQKNRSAKAPPVEQARGAADKSGTDAPTKKAAARPRKASKPRTGKS